MPSMFCKTSSTGLTFEHSETENSPSPPALYETYCSQCKDCSAKRRVHPAPLQPRTYGTVDGTSCHQSCHDLDTKCVCGGQEYHDRQSCHDGIAVQASSCKHTHAESEGEGRERGRGSEMKKEKERRERDERTD